MKKLINQNNYLTGILGVVVSEVLCAALVIIVLMLFHQPVEVIARWSVVALVPPVLLLRYYAKEQDYPDTLKATIVTLFVTTVALFWFLLRHHYVSFN